jgi:predicted nucleic acid-binding protein
VIAVDTSVVIAAFASWHEGHSSSAAVIAKRPRISSHVLVETYSVATRLPPPYRMPPAIVARFLGETFTDAPLVLPPREHMRFIQEATALGLTGGSIHDALVAATARHAGARLFTRDRRAVLVYGRLGVEYELVV